MAIRPWKYRLNIADIRKQFPDLYGPSTAPPERCQAWLNAVVSRIREKSDADKVNAVPEKGEQSIAHFLDPATKAKAEADDDEMLTDILELEDLLERMELMATSDDSLTIEDNNEFMAELYDWADGVRCWIEPGQGA